MNIHEKINKRVLDLVWKDMQKSIDGHMKGKNNPFTWLLYEVFEYYNLQEHLFHKTSNEYWC